jgi:hypothetical protein
MTASFERRRRVTSAPGGDVADPFELETDAMRSRSGRLSGKTAFFGLSRGASLPKRAGDATSKHKSAM